MWTMKAISLSSMLYLTMLSLTEVLYMPSSSTIRFHATFHDHRPRQPHLLPSSSILFAHERTNHPIVTNHTSSGDIAAKRRDISSSTSSTSNDNALTSLLNEPFETESDGNPSEILSATEDYPNEKQYFEEMAQEIQLLDEDENEGNPNDIDSALGYFLNEERTVEEIAQVMKSIDEDESEGGDEDAQERMNEIISKYKSRLIHCEVASYPNFEVYLCGTDHVSKSSVHMVKEVLQSLEPQLILLELCAERSETLVSTSPTDDGHEDRPSTFRLHDILQRALRERSIGALWVGLIGL
jgi:hypothetical protein